MKSNKKFRELAVKRVSKAIRDIQLVSNLANKSAYEYTEQDSKKIVSALEKEVKTLKAKFFAHGGDKEGVVFSF